MTVTGRVLSVVAAVTSLFACSSQADAADTATTGIAVGLGLQAASGKTTISNGGGATEAALLNSQALLKAGNVIRRVVEAAAGERRQILVLGHSDTLDFVTARSIQMRLADLRKAQPPSSQCKNKLVRMQTVSPQKEVALSGSFFSKLVPAPNDITAALATDITIQGITISTDDRLLMEAFLIGADQARWMDADAITPLQGPSVRTHVFRVPGDNVDIGPNNQLIADFLALQRSAGATRQCDSAAYKAWLSDVQAFQTSVLSSDKGGPAPLATAAALLALSPENARPLIFEGGLGTERGNCHYEIEYLLHSGLPRRGDRELRPPS